MLQILPTMAIEILYEDVHMLAVSKPSGQVVIPGRGNLPEEPVAAELERYTGKKIYVIHRLDRGASGILLLAKDAAAHRHLSMQFERREIVKTYLVLVQGLLETGGQINQPIRAFGSGRMGIDPNGKPSVTDFQVRERLNGKQAGQGATLLEVSPRTGRRHQIRVHFYFLGHPVMGDSLYGKERPVGGAPRLMLHAWTLDFLSPDGKRLALQAAPGPDFESALTLLRPQENDDI